MNYRSFRIIGVTEYAACDDGYFREAPPRRDAVTTFCELI